MASRCLILLCCLLLLPAQARADGQGASCADLKPAETAIEFHVDIADPFYDFSMSADDIPKKAQKTFDDWIKKNSMQAIWSASDLKAGGYASGAWGANYGTQIKEVPYDHFGAVICSYFTKLEINLKFRTLIAIPGEFTDKPCTYKVINDHEMQHYEANKKAVEIYVDKLKKDMPAIIAQAESEFVNREQIKQHFEDMKQAIPDAVKIYFDQAMTEKARGINAAIDTPQEFETRSAMLAACKGG